MSKWKEEKAEKNRRSLGRLTKALPLVFPVAVLSRALSRTFVPPTPRLAIDSYWGAHPLRADRLARALAARTERLAAGRGGSATTARTGCQLHSGHHQRPIGNAHSRGVPVSVVCAGNRSIASAGMSICGIPGPTRMQSGTAHAWSHGNSGPLRVITRGFCGVCKHDAAAKAVGGCGRAPKLITVSHCFGCGANTGIHSGRRYSIIGAYQTFR
jgi:hypothetical protein